MSVHVSWIGPHKTILCQRFCEDWTLKEYYRALEQSYLLVAEAGHPVDVVVNFSGGTAAFSRLISATKSALSADPRGRVHPNQRLMVVVGGGIYMRTILDMGARVAPSATRHLFCADSVEEALAIIYQQNLAYN